MSLSPVGATSSLRPADSERSLPQLAELAGLIARHAPVDGVHETAIPGVAAIRMSCLSQEFVHALHQPAVCIIAQGAKRVMLRDEVYSYDASRFLVFSVDLPISAQITQASPDALADASFRVGYESPSQFTREYSRLFGMPPSRDLQRLKQAVAA